MNKSRLLLMILSASLTACAGASSPLSEASDLAPLEKQSSETSAMVVTANPHATRAGADILRAGGSAVDAAVAIEAVLSLVEPQSSGLGGGGFMTYLDAKTKQIVIYDGREVAPASADPDMFIKPNGESMGYINAKNSGLSTGVPGMVSMLKMAHQDQGALPWGTLFASARALAVKGFPLSPRLQNFLVKYARFIPKTEAEGPTDAYRYFYDTKGEPHPVGYLRKNLDYAKTLDVIAQDPDAFYQGVIADQIIEQTQTLPRASGMVKADLENYSAIRREALCVPYQSLQLCGPPPPSSWLAIGMIMGLLEHAPAFSKAGASDPDNWTLFAEAQRIAYADRDHFVADPNYADVPVVGMLHSDYLVQRAKLIGNKANVDIAHGDPWAYQTQLPKVAGIDATNDVAGTTHFVVVDFDGNVVSMTASVESIFGSTRMAGGMFLNNQLTDFSFRAKDKKGIAINNAVAPGKQPRSSMSPTIVLDKNGAFLMATGSPGGNSIIAYTAKTLVGVLAWGMDPQSAINLPNMVARGNKVRIEKERASSELISGLRNFGYDLKESAGENSGLSVIVRKANGEYVGGVDPRREGVIEVLTR